MVESQLSDGEDSNGQATATGGPKRLRRLAHRDTRQPAVLANALCDVAKVRANRGAPASTEMLFDEAISRRNTTPESVEPELLFRIQSLMAYDYDCEGRHYDAIRHYEESLKLAGDCDSLDPIQITVVHNNLGMLYSRLNEFEQAERHYLAAVEHLEGITVENDPRVAAVHNNLGVLYFKKKEFERARAFHNKALRVRRRIHGEDPLHPDLGQTCENLASLHAAMGDAKTARVYRDRVREIRKGTPPLSASQRSRRSKLPSAKSNQAG
jgi:tetratricopeptide (TPR) repeat protein